MSIQWSNKTGIKIALGGLLVLFCRCGNVPDMKNEVWEIPCNYKGFLTVYFNNDKDTGRLQSMDRIYRFDTAGICLSGFGRNDGFTTDLNKAIKIKMLCDAGSLFIPYYDNAVSDTIKSDYYASDLIVGKKGDKSFKSILIVKKGIPRPVRNF